MERHYDAIFAGLMAVIGACVGWYLRSAKAEAELRAERSVSDRLRAQKLEVEQELIQERELRFAFRSYYR